jgi:dephospho-CoA kinase
MAVPLIGLTGGMGAGKSTALTILRSLGAETLSSDQVVHDLYREPAVVQALVAHFGEEVAEDGAIDRDRLAKAVFADPAQREWLERLTWPLVGQRIGAWIAGVRRQDPPPRAAVLEVPLLFESGLDRGYDATIAIVGHEGTIARRTASRDLVGVSERNQRQLSQAEKAARATYVVHNDGDRSELERELSSVLDNLTG